MLKGGVNSSSSVGINDAGINDGFIISLFSSSAFVVIAYAVYAVYAVYASYPATLEGLNSLKSLSFKSLFLSLQSSCVAVFTSIPPTP